VEQRKLAGSKTIFDSYNTHVPDEEAIFAGLLEDICNCTDTLHRKSSFSPVFKIQ
jgi:hypothetical protein